MKRYEVYYTTRLKKVAKGNLSNIEIIKEISRVFTCDIDDIINTDLCTHDLVMCRSVYLYMMKKIYNLSMIGAFNYDKSNVIIRIQNVEDFMSVDKYFRYSVNSIKNTLESKQKLG